MLNFLHKYGANYFTSQNCEEGVLIEVVKRMAIDEGRCVEIGGNDGLWCSNTALLLQDHAWHGLFVEYDYQLYLKSKENWKANRRVRHQCCKVDERNINAFVDESCDFLSLDTDGNDFRIFHGLRMKPKIVIIEIDSSMPPDQLGFNQDGAAGYREAVRLAQLRGYFLLCHTGNLLLLDEKYHHLFPEIDRDPLYEAEYYFNRAWLKDDAA
jgi:hypothetical protein